MISSASFMLYRKCSTLPLNDLIVTRAVWTGGRKCPPALFLFYRKLLDPAVDRSYCYPSSLDRREKVPTGTFYYTENSLTPPLINLIVTRAVWIGGRNAHRNILLYGKLLDPAVDQPYCYPSSLDRREKVPTGTKSTYDNHLAISAFLI